MLHIHFSKSRTEIKYKNNFILNLSPLPAAVHLLCCAARCGTRTSSGPYNHHCRSEWSSRGPWPARSQPEASPRVSCTEYAGRRLWTRDQSTDCLRRTRGQRTGPSTCPGQLKRKPQREQLHVPGIFTPGERTHPWDTYQNLSALIKRLPSNKTAVGTDRFCAIKVCYCHLETRPEKKRWRNKNVLALKEWKSTVTLDQWFRTFSD
jgi:hypothetical protein